MLMKPFFLSFKLSNLISLLNKAGCM